MWDTQHAVLFCQSLCMSAFELRSNLPASQALWEADSAESWHRLHRTQPAPPLFLSILKMYLNPSSTTSTAGGAGGAVSAVPKNLNALSRALILHGLMSIAWDMQRRDQTSLGVLDATSSSASSVFGASGKWQTRLAASYEAWHADYTTFRASYVSHFPSSTHSNPSSAGQFGKAEQQQQHPQLTEFHAHTASLLTLYHAAHILLHTPFLDLQIFAGARHILGRPVSRADYARSQKAVKNWVARNPVEARSSVWHAASLVRVGVEWLEDGGEGGSATSGLSGMGGAGVGSGKGGTGGAGSMMMQAAKSEVVSGARIWHLPWAVYLATLVVWGVGYTQPSSSTSSLTTSFPSSSLQHHNNNNADSDASDVDDEDDEDEIIWNPDAEMRRLLSAILSTSSSSSAGKSDSTKRISKKGANGMAAAVSSRLAKVRWAVVRDAMIVLRGLVCWRLVGGGGDE